MRLYARLDAYQSGKRRPIDLPASELPDQPSADELLNLAFHYGQNDFQARDGCASVSVGDVIELPNGSAYRVAPVGFEQISEGVYCGICGQRCAHDGRCF